MTKEEYTAEVRAAILKDRPYLLEGPVKEITNILIDVYSTGFSRGAEFERKIARKL